MNGGLPDTKVFWMPLTALQPSQLYINQEKLSVLQSTIDFSDPANIPPIPVRDLDDRWVMTDGHTRAFAAYLAGISRLPVYPDEDELDWEAYQICVRWCQEAGIVSVTDLQMRVISPERYNKLWLDRCMQMQNRLAEKRKS